MSVKISSSSFRLSYLETSAKAFQEQAIKYLSHKMQQVYHFACSIFNYIKTAFDSIGSRFNQLTRSISVNTDSNSSSMTELTEVKCLVQPSESNREESINHKRHEKPVSFDLQTTFVAAMTHQNPSEVKKDAFSTFWQNFDKALANYCSNSQSIDREAAIKKTILGFSYLQTIFGDGKDHKKIDALLENINENIEGTLEILDCISIAFFALEPINQGTYLIHEETENLEYFLSKLGFFKERLSSHFKGRTVGSPMGIDGRFITDKRHILYHILENADQESTKHSIAIKLENWGLATTLDKGMHGKEFLDSLYRKNVTGDNGEGPGYHKEHLLKKDAQKIKRLMNQFTALFTSQTAVYANSIKQIFKDGYGLSKAIPAMEAMIQHLKQIETADSDFESVTTDEMIKLKTELSTYVTELKNRENYHPERSGNEIILNLIGLLNLPTLHDENRQILIDAAVNFFKTKETPDGWVAVDYV